MILQIKSQGFPSIIKDLGVQSPLTGPFWGFDPVVVPTYQIGDLSLKLNAAQPYFPSDFDSDNTTDPGNAAVLAQSPQLPAGRYGFEVGWTFGSGAANGSHLTFTVIDAGSFTLRQYAFDILGTATDTRQYGAGQRFFVEDLQENDHVELINLVAMIGGTNVRTYLKWIFISALPFKQG